MSLPELPQGLHWRVAKTDREDALFLRVEAEHRPRLGPRTVAQGLAEFDPWSGAESIIQAVESTARDIVHKLNREKYLQQVIEDNWPDAL